MAKHIVVITLEVDDTKMKVEETAGGKDKIQFFDAKVQSVSGIDTPKTKGLVYNLPLYFDKPVVSAAQTAAPAVLSAAPNVTAKVKPTVRQAKTAEGAPKTFSSEGQQVQPNRDALKAMLKGLLSEIAAEG